MVIHPTDSDHFGHINSTDNSNAGWMRWYFNEHNNDLLGRVTLTKDVGEYVRHMKAYLILSIRGTIRQALRRSIPLRSMKYNPQKFVVLLYDNREEPP